jgi:hypothetical protein
VPWFGIRHGGTPQGGVRRRTSTALDHVGGCVAPGSSARPASKASMSTVLGACKTHSFV